MIAQAPALLETLTRVRVGDLFARIPGLREAASRPGTPDTRDDGPKGELR
jgi:hypothetical protein